MCGDCGSRRSPSVGIEDPHQRTARRAPRPEVEVRKRSLGELLRRALCQVLFGHAVEVAAQEALPQVIARPAARPGDSLDQRDACGRDTSKQVVLIN